MDLRLCKRSIVPVCLSLLRVGAERGIENAGLEIKADCGKTYFRSLLDPTPVMLQRLAVPPLSLATAEDGPQYFSQPG
jgi:hypothetical protein